MPRHNAKDATEALTLTPIAITRSCFADKFGVPRQPGLTRHAHADLLIQPPFDREDAFRGLESASHLWLTFQFHQAVRAEWRPVVRPPRLGGNRKIGVFASRSPFRPNSLGLSAVRNRGLVRKQGKLVLQISDHDLIEGTPILDIKPYLPFADAISGAHLSWAEEAPVERLPVVFLPEAQQQLGELCTENSLQKYPDFAALIEDVVSYDPRPSFRRGREEERIYGAHLYNVNVRFRFVTDETGSRVEVLTVC
ncbi:MULTISPECIES: tRNA (N6-threonylcarbamoyladenosine(37)-N6)-methyltransferase TrmO [unclassified Marinobacter]|uniref:tRNA (N6-threonylcarbamoyladenosine(37)-N6)-methyltransferase TrmO n=1 Tax=unclassified Marinobacter TaxID=83889 RepID=UPI00200FAB26|nr:MULTISPECIES: tRNA (N6-threonylcarbamoyladenosine(37)-N6)-methyltransferase TrmO [unclassified Marinobacter]UQG56994.1 tRNA (N6-threonylcarbamoyladenosine(37)-N6)-methyltransferase TrmO [Marinobacter sp. M4C]UQG65798.1 tRNA (N6-threonylcarbamoyladenosine(37)-N6)-methyltransferase TrmO [Marinobacter sp. M2C]UQG70078.1 tRNA (N6-threonylcarbamoyladenosine(37)-N6)-methyltransferase TrmO [Marinobacter sp. M1C]